MTKTDLMTADKEIELIRSLSASDTSSKSYKRILDELVLSNIGLVHKIVQKFPIKNASCSYEDLYHEGVAGLIHGIQKFDVTRGYRLSTYCYRWIQAYVARYFQNHGKTIRIPVYLSTQEMKTRKQIETLTEELGHTPSKSEIMDAGIETSDLVECTSLNAMITENDELECLQGEDRTENNDYVLDCEMMLDKLKQEVTPRDFNIFIHRYGLLGVPAHTLNEISDYHELTRSRCHQITNECIRKIRSYTH